MISLSEYCLLFNDALARAETIVLAAHCTIRYSGRAESYLGEGDRVIVIKSDGAVLVHQPAGHTPVNYMKPGCTSRMCIGEEGCVLSVTHLLERESMRITLHKIHFFNTTKLEDGQAILVAGTEEDMANMLIKNPEMIEDGFKPVSQEEQTKYGDIDILGTDRNGVLTVVECKRYAADLSAVTQLRRYVEKISVSKGIKDVRGILAAPHISENAKRMLEDWGYTFVSAKPPKYFEDFAKKQRTLDSF